MPSLKDIHHEIHRLANSAENARKSAVETIRRKHLKSLSDYTNRNIIAYYSGWLNASSNLSAFQIGDDDKNALMATIHGLDRPKGLDLILHTPGGGVAATESIVHYLTEMFGSNIRAIVPQIAMSAGTLIACSCSEIIMGKHSSLGPIDPQIRGLPAQQLIDEFNAAVKASEDNPHSIPIWQSIIGQYPPTLLEQAAHAIEWSADIACTWLKRNMLSDHENGDELAASIVESLTEPTENRDHGRHIHIDRCEEMGLRICKLEEDPELQDLVLGVHHAYMTSFAASDSRPLKIVENQIGVGYVVHGAQAR